MLVGDKSGGLKPQDDHSKTESGNRESQRQLQDNVFVPNILKSDQIGLFTSSGCSLLAQSSFPRRGMISRLSPFLCPASSNDLASTFINSPVLFFSQRCHIFGSVPLLIVPGEDAAQRGEYYTIGADERGNITNATQVFVTRANCRQHLSKLFFLCTIETQLCTTRC